MHEATQLRQHWAWETFFVLYKHTSFWNAVCSMEDKRDFVILPISKFTILLKSRSGSLRSKSVELTDLQVHMLVRESEGHIPLLLVVSCTGHILCSAGTDWLDSTCHQTRTVFTSARRRKLAPQSWFGQIAWMISGSSQFSSLAFSERFSNISWSEVEINHSPELSFVSTSKFKCFWILMLHQVSCRWSRGLC